MIATLVAASIVCQGAEAVRPQASVGWQALLDYSMNQYDRNFAEYKDTAVHLRTRRSHRAVGLLGANAVNAVDIASAAIETSVDGADAGITVAPLLLAGWATPGQVKVTLATLKDEKTRLGLAFSYELPGDDLDTYVRLKMPLCAPHRDKFEKELSKRQCPFERSCAVVARLPDPGAGKTHDIWLQARNLCGLTADVDLENQGVRPSRMRVDIAGLILQKATDDVAKVLEKRHDAGAEVVRGLQESGGKDFAEVSASVADDLDSCHAKDIGDEYVARTWETPKTSVGVQYAADAFTAIFGSSDPAATHGQIARHDVRAELDHSRGPLNLTIGMGYASERAAPGKPFQQLLKPSAEVSLVVAAIGGESLWTKTGVNVKDGAVVPHVTVGLSLSEESKEFSELTSMEITPYVAFAFSEKLLVRAGIPIRAKRACTADALAADSKCDPLAGSQPTEMQWTVPASIISVLKI